MQVRNVLRITLSKNWERRLFELPTKKEKARERERERGRETRKHIWSSRRASGSRIARVLKRRRRAARTGIAGQYIFLRRNYVLLGIIISLSRLRAAAYGQLLSARRPYRPLRATLNALWSSGLDFGRRRLLVCFSRQRSCPLLGARFFIGNY